MNKNAIEILAVAPPHSVILHIRCRISAVGDQRDATREAPGLQFQLVALIGGINLLIDGMIFNADIRKLHQMRILILSLLVIFASCKQGPSDKDIEQDLGSKFTSSSPGVVVSVKNGVATLSGTCPDESCKQTSESTAKSTKGVKEVVNNIIISTPPPAAPTVEISSTDSLQTSLNQLLASYKSVKGTVENGVITLTGDIKRSQLTPLMQSVNELKPKRVVNKLDIK